MQFQAPHKPGQHGFKAAGIQRDGISMQQERRLKDEPWFGEPYHIYACIITIGIAAALLYALHLVFPVLGTKPLVQKWTPFWTEYACTFCSFYLGARCACLMCGNRKWVHPIQLTCNIGAMMLGITTLHHPAPYIHTTIAMFATTFAAWQVYKGNR